MDSSIVVSMALGAGFVMAGPVVSRRAAPSAATWAMATAALHPVFTLGLFYSLAVHMHLRLGGWPARIGSEGLPEGLILHAALAQYAFGALLIGALLILPIALLFCACVPGWRSGMRCLGAYGGLAVLAILAMQLAPAAFLEWWWD